MNFRLALYGRYLGYKIVLLNVAACVNNFTVNVYTSYTEFQSVLGFRQQHMLKSAFNQSDLFFVCRMKPLTYDINPCQVRLEVCLLNK